MTDQILRTAEHHQNPNAEYNSRARIAHRRAFVLKYTIAGFNLSKITEMYNSEIAKVDGSFMVTEQTIKLDRMEALKGVRNSGREDAEVWRALLIERHEVAIRSLYPQVMAGHLGAIDRWNKTNEQLARLTGADAPVKLEITNPAQMSDDERRARILQLLEEGRRRLEAAQQPDVIDVTPD